LVTQWLFVIENLKRNKCLKLNKFNYKLKITGGWWWVGGVSKDFSKDCLAELKKDQLKLQFRYGKIVIWYHI
jgi:hypothetical protein